MDNKQIQSLSLDRSLYDDANTDRSVYKAKPGVSREVILEISKQKNEPAWMLEKRLKAFGYYEETAVPTWGPDLSKLNLDEIIYFIRPNAQEEKKWEDVPEDIKKTFEKLGIPEAEKKALAGVGAQYDSDVVYHNIKEDLKAKGVIFENMDVAVQKYPELVQKYFMTSCVPINDHKFVMLHGAVWSGGTFIYVPKNVKVGLPLQAYFRMNAESGGQFEHTLIIADEGSELEYIEGCSAPRYTTNSLHAGCVEIFVHKNAKVKYFSIENWSKNTYNLNTKRALVDQDASIEWVSGNMGCLTENAKVPTSKGPISIKNIKKGDTVFSWSSDTRQLVESKVINQIYSGEKEVFSVQAGGRSIEASLNHPFLTVIRKKKKVEHKKYFFELVWKPLSELNEGDVIAITKSIPIIGESYIFPKLNLDILVKSKNQYSKFEMSIKNHYSKDIFLPKETSIDLMWFIGLMMGDGHVDLKGGKLNLATHVTEDYRDHLCDVIRSLFGYNVTEKQERYIIVNSMAICKFLSHIGCTGTAGTKKIPQWLFQLPEDQILAFLAGYFDADGHAQEFSVAYTSINKELLEDVKLLALQLGFGVSQIIKHRQEGRVTIIGNDCHANNSWRLMLNGPKIYELPSRCKRKKNKIAKIKTRRVYKSVRGMNLTQQMTHQMGFAKITKKESLGIHKTYDIEVEKYHNFVANGLIVHNSGVTMLYPCSILRGRGAHSDSLGIAFAGPGQHQDTGAKAIHVAPNTSSIIRSRSISVGGGIAGFRGLIKVTKNAVQSTASMSCDALLLDEGSKADTYPALKIDTNDVSVAHEARIGKIGEEQLFYLMSRGMSAEQAMQLIVSGFVEPIVKALPLEYAIELSKLIELEMDGAVG